MRITLTTAQAVALTDASEADNLRGFPLPYIGELGHTEDGYVIDHPELTAQDELVLKYILDERVAAYTGPPIQAGDHIPDHAISEVPPSQVDRVGLRENIMARPGIIALLAQS